MNLTAGVVILAAAGLMIWLVGRDAASNARLCVIGW